VAVFQIFGTKKCQDTRKAERWFKERGLQTQLIDLKQKGPSAGELRSIAQHVPLTDLVDRESPRFRDKGLRAAAFTGALLEKLLVEDPLLLKTPIVRAQGRATVGYKPEIWEGWPK
jgi:arsenate reductase-like glutaredoxin family protein